MRSVMHSPVLVLNASYEPLHICAARRALTLVVEDAAHIRGASPVAKSTLALCSQR